MSRLALALAAILLLLLSTSFTTHSFGPSSPAANALALAGGGRSQLMRAGEIDLALSGPAIARPSAPAAPDDTLAPALLVYLGLVLVGSAVAIGVVRSNVRHES